MLLNTAVKTVKRKSHRGDQNVTTDLITTDIIACVNEAIRDVVKLLPKRFWFKSDTIALVAGVAGTPAVYSLPSDCQEPINFYFTSNNQLYVLNKVLSDREWIRGYWDPAQSVQKPMWYREIGANSSTNYKQIEVFPIPDASYTLTVEYYKTQGSDLTTSDLGSVIPNIPDQFLDVVEKGAFYYFLKGFDDPFMSVAKSDYEEAKRAMEFGDDRDSDADVSLRFMTPAYNYPGFLDNGN